MLGRGKCGLTVEDNLEIQMPKIFMWLALTNNSFLGMFYKETGYDGPGWYILCKRLYEDLLMVVSFCSSDMARIGKDRRFKTDMKWPHY